METVFDRMMPPGCQSGRGAVARRWLRAALAVMLSLWIGAPVSPVFSEELVASPPPASDRHWGFWFSADALYMSHSQAARSVRVVDGPESFRLGDATLGWQPGTRLTAGFFEDDYEVSGSYVFFSPWSNERSGVFQNGLDFDGPAAYFAADPAAQAAVDPLGNPNFLSAETLFSVVNTAANASGETDALEFLRPGIRFDSDYTTEFSDVEINFSQREQQGRPWRFGIGFRHTLVQESGFAALSGAFGTTASFGGGLPFNNGLSAGSLTGSGLILLSPAITNTGFSDAVAAPPRAADQLLFVSNTRTVNQLYGVQVSTEAFLYQADNLSLSFFVKPGVYVNQAKGTIDEVYASTLNDQATYGRRLFDRSGTFSFIGHIGTTCRYFVLENVALSAGYEMFYVTGLALATDQLNQISTPVTGAASLDLRTDNAVLLHGGRIGIEIAF